MKSHHPFFAVLTTLATLTLQRVSAQTDVNLLSNGSFERFVDTAGVPDAWTKLSPYGTISVIAATPSIPSPNAADFILKLNDTSSTTSTSIISDPVTATVGASYTAESYIQRNGTSATPNIYIKFYNSSGTEIGSASSSSVSGVNVWEYVSLTATAPSGTVTAKVICYSKSTSVGLSYFDGVSLRRNGGGTAPLLRYVSKNGSGSGTTYGSPAYYNSSTFWSGVQSSLGTQAIKVIFLSGQYVMDDPNTTPLFLYTRGTANWRLTLEGEHPFGSVFTRTNSAPDETTGSMEMVKFGRSQNITVRHLHWESQITNSSKLTGYGLMFYSGTTGTECKNFLVEGCSFVGLEMFSYGALGIQDVMTHDVEVRYCEFVRGGFDSHYHMIYNADAAHHLTFGYNFFQDCGGAYLRLRAGCHDASVNHNDFVSTPATSGNSNVHFVEVADFNDVNPGDEMWGYNLTIADNLFDYVNSGSNNVAIHLHHSGYNPRINGITWPYLLTAQNATTLNGTNATAERAILTGNFGLVVPGGNGTLALFIDTNTRIGFHTYNVQLESEVNYGATNNPLPNGDGAYNISEVFAND